MPLRLLLRPLLRLATLFIGYFLPALRCIKSILQKDAAQNRALVLHFVILHIVHGLVLTPLFRCGALNPMLEFPVIFWLAGPTQGSMVVFECILAPLLARFEGQVDEEIERRRRVVRERTVRFMLSGGAVIVAQLWEMISTLLANGQDETGFFAGENEETNNKSGLDPQHSVRASLHSIQSSFGLDSIDADEGSNMDIDGANDQDTFLRDFLAMLSQGLYVFAHIPSTDDDQMDIDGNDDDATNKTFRLQVFSYNDDSNRFELSTVDHRQTDTATSTTLPILEIGKVEASGGQAITIALAEGEVEIVLSDEDDRNILLSGLEACIEQLEGVKENDNS